MAGFAPTAEIQVPQDELFRSRPMQPDRTLADLFGDIGKTVTSATGYLYENAKQDIWNQVDSIVNKQVESQPGVQSALDRAGNSNLQQILGANPVLADSYAEQAKNKTAMDQGVMDRSMYWAKLTIAAKELRSKYPGWGQDISEMFNNLTGAHTLEGHLNSAVEAENAAKADKISKLDQERWSDFRRVEDLVAQNPDGKRIVEGVHSGEIPITSPMVTQATVAGIVLQGKQKSTEIALNQMKFNKEQGQVDVDKGSKLYAGAVNDLVQSVIKMVPPNADGTDILTTLGKMDQKDPRSAQMIGQMGQWFDVQAASLASRFSQLRNQFRDIGMTPAQFSEIENSELKPIQDIQKLVGGKDPTLLATAANMWRDASDKQALILTNNFPVFANLAALGKISPDLVKAENIQDPRIWAAVTEMVRGGTAEHAMQLLNAEPGAKPPKVSEQLGNAIQTTVDGIAKGQISQDLAINFVQKNMVGDRAGLDSYYTNLNADGKQQFFEKVTTPNFQDAVIKASQASPGLKEGYAAWVTSKFHSLPAIAPIQDTISENKNADPKNQVTFGYDPLKGGVTIEFPDGYKGPNYGLGRAIISKNVNQFNTALYNMKSLYEKMGLNSVDETKRLLAGVFKP